ncbi:MAG: zf-HC2 domain-containing protein [bacterium]|nr:zf-HC2 domain-containing protein [bacterium]
MRCQKVRSCLSAYCKDELTGREVLAVREHLSTCAACRQEEVMVRGMDTATREMPKVALSGDFNTRLLNRIAEERFAETRTKAYLPQRAPRFAWRTLAPVLSSALVLTVVAIAVLTSPQQVPLIGSEPVAQSDDYQTVQPTNNPNMSPRLKANWSLRSELAQTERMNRLSGMLTSSSSFSNVAAQSSHGWAGHNQYFQEMLKMRPVIRVYQPANSTQVSEARAIY